MRFRSTTGRRGPVNKSVLSCATGMSGDLFRKREAWGRVSSNLAEANLAFGGCNGRGVITSNLMACFDTDETSGNFLHVSDQSAKG